VSELFSATHQLPLWRLAALVSPSVGVRVLVVVLTVTTMFCWLRGKG
jgi:hypothetical protein